MQRNYSIQVDLGPYIGIISGLRYDYNGMTSEQKREQMSLRLCVKSPVPQFNPLNKVDKKRSVLCCSPRMFDTEDPDQTC